MRYVLAAFMLALATEAIAEDKPAPTITRTVKVDEAYKTFITEDIETGCQTIILLGGHFLSVAGLAIPRLTADGKPWCRNTVPH